MDTFMIFLTSLLSIAALFLITKLMGHKQISQLNFFDYITGITIGSIAAELATELEAPLRPFIAIAVYGAVSIILNLIMTKFQKSRKYLNGTPTIFMRENKIYRDNLKKAKIDLSEFMVMCRQQGYFDLREIDTAIFECNGKLSVLPRSAKKPLTPSDMGISVNSAKIFIEVIMDGRILVENLKRAGINTDALKSAMNSQGRALEDVFLGLYDGNSFQFY